MRHIDGLALIMDAMDKLKSKHDEHMKVYGTCNDMRMTGTHETAKFDEFSWGIGDRGASVRIPNQVVKDRRPASNCDPYLVTSQILKTVME